MKKKLAIFSALIFTLLFAAPMPELHAYSTQDVQLLSGLQAMYTITDVDTTSPNYYGFVMNDGSWYIMKETISGASTTYRFAKGSSSYTTNWTGRAGLTYDYYYNVFAA